MCIHCAALTRDLDSGTLTAAEADRSRTLIRICERYTANPPQPTTIISDALLAEMIDNDPTLTLD